MMSPDIEFDIKALAPVAMFKAETDIRYYLNGICVQPNKSGPGCFIIGCDGHRLAIWHDPAGTCSRQTILKASKELVSASRKKAAKDGSVCFEDGRLIIKDRDGQEAFIQAGKAEIEIKEPLKDGLYYSHSNQYPDVWRVIPKASNLVPGMLGAINGRYIEAIGKVSKLLEDGGLWGHACGVWHFSSKAGKDWGSVLTRFAKAPGFIVITMPMRQDDFEINSLPAEFYGQCPADVSAPATLLYPMGSMGEAASA